ncbi:unnamed protein product, partial [marine sediment metagenome]
RPEFALSDVLGTAQELLESQADLTQKLEEMGKEIDKHPPFLTLR